MHISLQTNSIVFLMIVFACFTQVNAEDKKSDFSKVKSIFENKCLHCHNNQESKGDFSLQTESRMLESGMLEVGDPNSSHLMSVIQGEEGESPQMPKGSDPLSKKELEIVANWIKQGASWPENVQLSAPEVTDYDWWSFQPLQVLAIPQFSKQEAFAKWPKNEIDHFVLAKLKEQGLSPSAKADRLTLIRRVTFDLTGLPPTPQEVQQFINDQDSNAYEKLVDRLLASKHYGERWARHWLDVVKYADTCGYDKDKLRNNAWPYRDYVIRSFNQDKPYAQFIKEQIAGDILYPNSQDGILGLGFIAAGPWDFIGHVEVPESKLDGQVARNLDRDEMLSNTINTFMSLTIQCARCHNHKFDPITQKNYYGMQAIFAAVDRAERVYDLDPEIEKQKSLLKKAIATKQRQMNQQKANIAKLGGDKLIQLNQQITQLKKQIELKNKEPEFGYHSSIEKIQATTKWVQVDLGKLTEVKSIVLNPCHDDFAGIGAGFGFPIRFRVELSEEPSFENAHLILDQSNRDFPNPGLDPLEISIDPVRARYIRVTATKLAERSNDFIFALAELQAIDNSNKNVALGLSVEAKDSIQAPVRWAKKNLTDGLWPSQLQIQDAQNLSKLIKEKKSLLAKAEISKIYSQIETLSSELKSLEQQFSKLPQGKVVYAAATQFKGQGNFKPTGGKPRPIYLLHRGNVNAKRELLSPALIKVSDQFDSQINLPTEHLEGDRRAALASWIADENNPLTWRSIVNRIWLNHFDQGLVASPNDFGKMGQLPTHPQLLDWLAIRFRDQGQSFKDLHRLIVTSATYRQSSDFEKSKHLIDSGNQYYWRMNRRRLDAEEIRDAILTISGQLNTRMGGPGFYQFVLEKTAHSPHYQYHKFDPKDTDTHRRSIYRFVVRSSPDPYMTTLDCADSSQSTPKREETVTSLQALAMLNNRFNLTMADYFATHLKSEKPSLESQVKLGFERTTGRLPTPEEQLNLQEFAKQHGLKNYCRLLFNLNEFIYLD